MSRYELSLAKDYVPKWTVVDAVRELFQNALDQQITVKGNDMFFNYDAGSQILSIGNKESILNVNTLLLGASTKRNDPNTIGQFGEGYKIATLVLTRKEKKVTFYNYGAKEVWKPRFVKSRRYDGAEILTFFVDKKFVWQKVPDNNLTITIENITTEEHQEIVDSNLHLQEVGEVIETQFGRILMDVRYRGKVFVNGLFVCTHQPYTYGYDFKPQFINIDRDRKLANALDLEWMSSKMWSCLDDEKTIHLVKAGSADVAYISHSFSNISTYKTIADKVLDEFKREHGANAVPVSSQEEFESVEKKYKPIFVSSTYSSTVKASDNYKIEYPQVKKLTVKERLEEWLNHHKQSLSKKAIQNLKEIMNEVKN